MKRGPDREATEPLMPLPMWEASGVQLVWLYRQAIDMRHGRGTGHVARNTITCWLVHRGGVQIETPAGRAELKPGGLALLCDVERTIDWRPGSRLTSLSVELVGAAGSPLAFRGLLTAAAGEASRLRRTISALGRWVAETQPTARLDRYGKGVPVARWFEFQELLAAWTAAAHAVLAARPDLAGSTANAWVAEVARAIEAEPHLAKSGLAARVGVSLPQLRRRVRASGSSLDQLVAATRLRNAEQVLAQPEGRVKEAAAAAGFASTQAFARWFRQRTGVSPREFQQALRGI